VLELRHVLFSGAFFRERPGQHELGFEHGAAPLDHSVEGGGHPSQDGMMGAPLDIPDHLAGVGLIPTPVQVLGHTAQLDKEVAGQVLRLHFSTLLLPQAQEGGLVAAHNDASVRAADHLPAREIDIALGALGGPILRMLAD
jgi:hypothetical protein